MEHRKEIQSLIATVEETSGYPLTLLADQKLTTHSALSIARGSLQAHIIRYNPKYERLMDYIVAYHSGFILRFFSDPPEERRDFGATESGRFNVQKLVKRLEVAKNLPTQHLENICGQILTGLMTHLRSTPIGLRVEAWIESDLPSIRDQQRSGVEEQLRENLLPLEPAVKKISPQQIYDATLSVSAAYTIYWAEKWDQPQLIVPYNASGHAEMGRRLYAILLEAPDSPQTDRDLVDAWAAELGLQKWHTWVPYSEP